MTRIAIMLVVAFTLLGAAFFAWKSKTDEDAALEARKADREKMMNAKGKVVFAIREIPEGAVIDRNFLEQVEIEQSKIPQGACLLCNAVGRKARYGISQGQIVSNHDLDPDPAPRWPYTNRSK